MLKHILLRLIPEYVKIRYDKHMLPVLWNSETTGSIFSGISTTEESLL